MSPPWETFHVAVVSAKLLTWSWPRCGTRRSRWRPNRSHAGARLLVSRFGGRWNGRRAMFGRQSGGCGDTRARKPMLSQAIHNNGEGLKGGFVVYLSKRHVRIIFCCVGDGIHQNGVAPAMYHLVRNSRQHSVTQVILEQDLGGRNAHHRSNELRAE